MRIALLGGTGDVGEGLAVRWGRDTDHELLVGSRDPERAREAATAYAETVAADTGGDPDDLAIKGFTNEMAADRAEIVVLAVPPYHVADTVETVADGLDADDVVVTPAAGMQRDEDGFSYHPPGTGSVAALVREETPDAVPVVGAFHNLAAGRLAALDAPLGIDTLVFGDADDAVSRIVRLAEEIDGLRALRAGGLGNAPEVESLTPLLINVARENDDLHDLGVRFD
ncbi:NADPH-dependent F420 reductase [Halobaculum sp. MBLA0147]|uniref:NADPH-dependent F420 reductase n=1 Tax=Halobaculum sp. MBLA0147 TaxID=3079934 RepID=UPI003525703E